MPTPSNLLKLVLNPVQLARATASLGRTAWRVLWCTLRASQSNRATEMSAALTYRTIFSLVPTIVLSMLVFRAFVDMDQAYQQLQDLAMRFFNVPVVPDGGYRHQGGARPAPSSAEPAPASQSPAQPSASKSAATVQPASAAPSQPQPATSDASTTPTSVSSASVTSTSAPASGAPASSEAQPAPAAGTGSDAQAQADQSQEKEREVARQMRLQIDQKLRELIDGVSRIRFESIGAVGVCLLIWAALSLMITVEDAANRIYRAPKGRSMAMRIVIYWSVITLGPLLLFTSIYLTTRLLSFIQGMPVLGSWLGGFTRFGALLASWLLLFIVYRLLPNSPVSARAAAVGSLLAAVAWELGKFGFTLYVRRAMPYSNLYGTLGLVPLFLFWTYLNWFLVLLGLQLTHTLQALQAGAVLKAGRDEEDRTFDSRWTLPVLVRIAQRFDEGRPPQRIALAQDLGLPQPAVSELVDRLIQAGFIHEVSQGDGDPSLSLSRPAEHIDVSTVVNLSLQWSMGEHVDGGGPGWRAVKTLGDQEKQAAQGLSLAQVLRA